MAEKIHVVATFDGQTNVLAGMRHSVSWVKVDEEDAQRALTKPLPPVLYVHVDDVLKRLDEISLEEAKDVIRRLCDELMEKP